MNRYARQEILKHIGKEGQKKLSKATVAIVGLGAIGSVSSELLARAGIGKFILIDHDTIDETNLQRQVMYAEEDVGKPKAAVCKEKLNEINSQIKVEAKQLHLTYDVLDVLKADVILDCTDNMYTRFLVNDFSLKNKIPWIYAGAVEDRGMLFVTNGKPCFNCIFEKMNSLENCDNIGILNAASAQIAAMQVTEALKLLLGKQYEKNLLHVNFWNHEIKKIKVKENPKCKACNGNYVYLEKPEEDFTLTFCRTRQVMSAKPLRKLKLDFESLKKQFEVVSDSDSVLGINVDGENIIVRDYGELFFAKETNEERLKGLVNKIYSSIKI